MNKKIIAIASILKPLKDPRLYERFALSLAKANKYDINIIANDEKKTDEGNISFHSNGGPGRNLLHRLRLQWRTWKEIVSLRPDILILCSVELLPFTLVYSAFSRTKIIYDIQENYSLNFTHLGEYGWLHKYILSWLIRLLEKLSHFTIDHYLLAEKCYADQLDFIKSGYTVLENKTVIDNPMSPVKKEADLPIKFLFSGTISEYSGIHRVVALIHKLLAAKINFEFTVIGQYFDEKINTQLREIKSSRVHLILDHRPISHEMITTEIRKANLGVIAYHANPVNRNKIPSKLYEYTSFGLPYLVEKDSHWAEIGKAFGGAIEVDFEDISLESVFENIAKHQSPSTWGDRIDSLWKGEETKFINIIDRLTI